MAGVSSTTVTFTSSVTAGNSVLVVIASYYSDAVNSPQSFSVSDNKSNTYTRDVNAQGSGGGTGIGAIEYFRCDNVTGGSGFQLTINAGIAAYTVIFVIEYSGLDTTGSFDKSSSKLPQTTGSTYTSNSTATTSTADELLLGIYYTYSTAPTVTPDSPWSSIFESNQNGFIYAGVSDQTVSATGTYAFTGSVSGNATQDGVAIATYKAAGGGGTTPKPKLLSSLGVG